MEITVCDVCHAHTTKISRHYATVLGIRVESELCNVCATTLWKPLEELQTIVEKHEERIRQKKLIPLLRKLGKKDFATESQKGAMRFLEGTGTM
jgi:hypothetical protein